MPSRSNTKSAVARSTVALIAILLVLGTVGCNQATPGETTVQEQQAGTGEQPVAPPDKAGETAVSEVAGDVGTDRETPAGTAAQGTGGDGASAAGPPTSSAAAAATALVEAVLPTYVRSFGVPGSGKGELMLPFDVALDSTGDIFVSDSTGVQKFDAEGSFITQVGEGEVLTALGGIAIGPDDTLYVTGFEAQVLTYGPDGESRGPIGEPGSAPGQLARPVDVAVDAAGNIYVADAQNARVEKFDPAGRHLATIGEPGTGRGQFRTPRAVAIDADGNVIVGEGDNFLLQRFTPDGEYLDTFGMSHADENIWRIGGIAIGDDGVVYVTQAMENRLQAFDPTDDYALAWEFGSLGAGNEQFSTPMGMDFAGGLLYVADQMNNRVVVYRPTQ